MFPCQITDAGKMVLVIVELRLQLFDLRNGSETSMNGDQSCSPSCRTMSVGKGTLMIKGHETHRIRPCSTRAPFLSSSLIASSLCNLAVSDPIVPCWS